MLNQFLYKALTQIQLENCSLAKLQNFFQYLAAMDTVWDNGSIRIDYLKKSIAKLATQI